MPAEFTSADVGAETEEESEDFTYEVEGDEEAQLRELEFRPLDGRFMVECVGWRHFDGRSKDNPSEELGEPAVIFDFVTVENSDTDDNERQLAGFFAPITGPRKGELTKVFLALSGRAKPKVISPETIDALKGCITEAQVQSYKIKKGNRKGQRVNRIVDFFYGTHGSTLQEWLEDRRAK